MLTTPILSQVNEKGDNGESIHVQVQTLRNDINQVLDAFAEATFLIQDDIVRSVSSDEAKIEMEKEQRLAEHVLSKIEAIQLRTLSLRHTDSLNEDPRKMLANIITKISTHLQLLNEQLCSVLKNKSQATKNVLAENKSLRVSLQREEAESTHQRQKYHYMVTEKNTALATCKTLEEQLEERSKRITQLQRDGTIALWKKEKQKIIENIGSREAKLEAEVKASKLESDEIKLRLQRKITELTNQVKLMKVERQLLRTGRGPHEDFGDEDVEELRRQIFLKDRAIIIAESEIQKQQKYFAGFIQGIQKDFRVIMSKMNIDEDKYDRGQRTFHTMLDNMLIAAREGTFSSFRTGLPSHYLGINLNTCELPLKRNTRHKSLPSISSNLDANEEQTMAVSSLSLSPSLVSWREGKNCNRPNAEELLREATLNGNENQLINTERGILNMEEARKQFAGLSDNYVQDLFEQFKRFDTNKDWHLDTPELLRAVPDAMGRMATTDEITEAMKEVDVDKSGTIDFSEFVNVAQMLEKGEGRAPLFKKKTLKALQKTQSTSSTICEIQ